VQQPDSDPFRATRKGQKGTLGNNTERQIHSMTSAFPDLASSAQWSKRVSQAENAGSIPVARPRPTSRVTLGIGEFHSRLRIDRIGLNTVSQSGHHDGNSNR
jgi:hypothetical protein